MIDLALLEQFRRAIIHLLNAIDDVLIDTGRIPARTLPSKAERRRARREQEQARRESRDNHVDLPEWLPDTANEADLKYPI